MSWIEGNYRRNLMDMHIDDWNPEFLSKINVDEYVQCLKDCGAQAAMIKGKPHTGLCYYPTKIGRMHKGDASGVASCHCGRQKLPRIPQSGQLQNRPLRHLLPQQ